MKSNLVLPITIVVAGALIAGAVFWAGKSGTTNPNGANPGAPIKAVAYDPANDHVLGNPNAPVKVIEYMDLECPHCKAFNTTLHQVMDYYGSTGKVAWVTRNFPLAQIHSKAPEEAQAAECAAAQGGDAEYYKYIDDVFATTPSDNGLDLAQLPAIAQKHGLDVTKFNQCVSSGQFSKLVNDQYNQAIAAGGQGTPYILITVGTDAVALSGDQPYDSMRAAIDAVLANLPASATQNTGTTTGR
ncbi:MAG TPA: thioredoxin domain-containing protein [Candidatus Paceibacterota bacterium]